jgi:hypothetical protein
MMVSHAQPSYARPKDGLPAGVSFASDTSSGPSFFERLFGGPRQPEPTGRKPQQRPQQQRVITR